MHQARLMMLMAWMAYSAAAIAVATAMDIFCINLGCAVVISAQQHQQQVIYAVVNDHTGVLPVCL